MKSGGPILAKNRWLWSPNDAVGFTGELEVEIEGTGEAASSNGAIPFLSCSRIDSAMEKAARGRRPWMDVKADHRRPSSSNLYRNSIID
ncbi:OTU domain-containing protein [Pyrus ussuriensis x Pyrus communis]|uniref:OTU domain-containing protein n=1 Tax=Pyrus ussuriensis x Pyrus communis TaxID=2448454 RepID=A0A5N5HQP4_9ROSA|nr:OTU domain-containing protein [Pyrus ussuriensis x Pyrus communis]